LPREEPTLSEAEGARPERSRRVHADRVYRSARGLLDVVMLSEDWSLRFPQKTNRSRSIPTLPNSLSFRPLRRGQRRRGRNLLLLARPEFPRSSLIILRRGVLCPTKDLGELREVEAIARRLSRAPKSRAQRGTPATQ
jgi:hypothetical protein